MELYEFAVADWERPPGQKEDPSLPFGRPVRDKLILACCSRNRTHRLGPQFRLRVEGIGSCIAKVKKEIKGYSAPWSPS